MAIVEDIDDIINLIKEIKDKKFYDFVTYLSERNGDDRKFSVVRKKFPDLMNNIDTLEFLLENDIIWIEIDGKVHPGKVADGLYNLITKLTEISE